MKICFINHLKIKKNFFFDMGYKIFIQLIYRNIKINNLKFKDFMFMVLFH